MPQGDKQFIIKLKPGDKGLVSQRVPAALGQRANGKVELLQGVAEGDTVVLAGQARLMRADGLPVRVVDIQRPGGGGRPGGPPAGAGSAPRAGAASGPAAAAASAAPARPAAASA